MDLSDYDLGDLLVTAIKSEEDSNQLYTKMAKKTKNGLLKDKFEFLANEENKHRQFIEEIYANHFPDNKLVLPEDSPVPMPKIEFTEDTPLSKLLIQAMNAEMEACEFYKSLANRFDEGSKLYNTLVYFSDMEFGHYKILDMEKESMERFEEGDVYWPMVHVGP
jgi:rubrerythrin